MKNSGTRRDPSSPDGKDRNGQRVHNGVVINHVSSSKNAKKKSSRNESPIQGDPSASNRKSCLPQGCLSKHRKKRLTRKQVAKRIGVVVVAFLVVLAVGVGLLWNYIFSGFETQVPTGTVFPTEALTYQPPESKDITNILLLGVDSRNPAVDRGLSDAIIILTIDSKNNVLKMTSIMRDCFVYIPGYSAPEKINAAHSLGGPELAMRTINNTLRLNIKKYMVVNFQSMADIIDLAGGVTLTITEAERIELTKMFQVEFPSIVNSLILKSAGTQKLNGKQAVMYARIRYIGSDAERTRRQRDVLKSLFLGFKEANAVNKAQMIQKGLSLITTNMTSTEITAMGLNIIPKMSNEIEQLRLPIDGYFTVNSTGVWFMNVDYNRMIPEVYKFIYGETQPFDPVPTIPKIVYSSSKSSSVSVSQESSMSEESSMDSSMDSSDSSSADDSVSASISSSDSTSASRSDSSVSSSS